jgi:hypothetical protein
MAIGGRPAEEGGHTATKLSMNRDIHECLEKIRENGGNISKFVEEHLQNPCKHLDPGEACVVVSKIKQILDTELASAHREGNYSKMQVLAQMRGRIETDVAACGLGSTPNDLENKKDQYDQSSPEKSDSVSPFGTTDVDLATTESSSRVSAGHSSVAQVCKSTRGQR